MSKETLTPMQQELLDRADSIFESVAKTVTNITDIAKEQLPDIAHQYLMFQSAYITFMMVLSIVLGYVGYLFIKKGIAEETSFDMSMTCFLFGVAPAIISSLVLFSTYLKDFFMVWFAPKIFLITHIVQLVKG